MVLKKFFSICIDIFKHIEYNITKSKVIEWALCPAHNEVCGGRMGIVSRLSPPI